MGDFASLYFLIRHNFCMWNSVSADKESSTSFIRGTKFHIQKCNTCRDIEKNSYQIIFKQCYSIAPTSTKFSTRVRLTSNFVKAKKYFSRGRVKKAWLKIKRSCGEANLTLYKNLPNSPDGQMAENLDPPQIAGRHFFVDIKTMHFGRNGSSNSTTEAACGECRG